MSVAEEQRSEASEGEPEKRNTGRIEEIQGVVIEAVFPDKLPEIYHAIAVQRPEVAKEEEEIDIAAGEESWLICEVQQHLGRRSRARGGHGHHRRALARAPR